MTSWFHGIKAVIAVLGSVLALVATAVSTLVGIGVIGGDRGPDNLPPIVGSITLASPVVVAGQSVRAEVGVSDPERDQLVIQWSAESGRFLEGDTGKSVIYEPPGSGASFQLTAAVSDGRNPPVRVSDSFVLATPTPVPGAEPPTRPPPVVAPAARDLTTTVAAPPAEEPTPTPTSAPAPPPVDLSGIWRYRSPDSDGYLEFSRAFGEGYDFLDYNALGFQIGQGAVVPEGSQFNVEGFELVTNPFTGLSDVLAYTGTLEALDRDSLKASLRFQGGPVSNLTIDRIDPGDFP